MRCRTSQVCIMFYKSRAIFEFAVAVAFHCFRVFAFLHKSHVIYSAILYTLQIFKHPLYHQYPPPISYQLNFLKWCISQVKYECCQSMFSDVPPENTHTFSSLPPLFHLSPLTFSLSCSLIQGRGWESGSVWWTLWALWLPYFPATLHTYKSLFQVIPDSEATYM